jgi:hypothetical protein
MAIDLTPEQLVAVSEAAGVKQHEQLLQLEGNRARLEAVRLARETLAENRRSMPAGTPGITPEEITVFANTLVTYIVR